MLEKAMDKALDIETFTTLYVGPEDRIRLAATRGDGARVVLWFTQKLIRRLVPHVVSWLEAHDKAGKSTEVQSFRQQVARAQHKPQPPVKAAEADHSWLVQHIDVASHAHMLRLIFKGGDAQTAILPLTRDAARQWLHILYVGHQRGEWPTENWPEWIRAENQSATPAEMLPN